MTLRELQLFSLEILKDVHAFCENNNIKYSLYGGTLLGAIRHKGFIPWDDDIDIIMPRPDYNKFCANYISNKFDIVNINTDKSFSFAYSRVCDRKETIYTCTYPCNRKGMGVWIDVFPADGFPPDENCCKEFYDRSLFLYKRNKSLRWGLSTFSYCHIKSIRGVAYNIKQWIVIHLKKLFLFMNGWENPYVKKTIELCQTYNYGGTPYWGSVTSPYNHMVYHEIKEFETCSLHKFEDSQFYILKGYDEMLKRVYGDYMQLPPENNRKPPLSGAYKFYWL